MTSSIQARLAAARQAFAGALGGQFQKRINFRTGQIDYVNYSPDGRLLTATVTVDGVSGIPVSADTGVALHVGDAIEMINWGSAAGPDLQYNRHVASNFADAGTSPAATLPTPIGLTLTTALRNPTTGGQVAEITASWQALSDAVMGAGGYYEVELRRNDEAEGDGHVSRCPHRLGVTALDGSATYNDATITVDDTSAFPAAGKLKIADSVVTYTSKSATQFLGCTWAVGSGTYTDAGVTGLTLSLMIDHLATGTQYNVRVRAVSATAAVSEWTEWASVKTGGNLQLQIKDKFDDYGGDITSPLTGLHWWQLGNMDSYSDFFPAGGTSTNTVHVIEGPASVKMEPVIGSWAEAGRDSLSWNLNDDPRFTSADYLLIAAYVEQLNADGQAVLEFNFLATYASPPFYTKGQAVFTMTATGWHYLKMKRSDFVEVGGTVDWMAVYAWQMFARSSTGNPQAVVCVDDVRIIKADPDNPTTYNDTGSIWNFVPAISSGAEWHIYTDVPTKPFALGQIYTAASPTNWLLAYHTLSDVYYGTGVSGLYLKGVDGEAMLAFCIRDPTVANRTMYAVELDTATDHVRLVKWLAGVRTQIAEADFVSAPDQIVWLGAEWRDFDDEGRIKVYATLVEGNVLQASNLVLSEIDADVQRGGFVGVGSKEAILRVVDFRAGSPQHAMTAEHAFHAALADVAVTISADEPSASWPGMFWYDTTAGALKLRKLDNSGWYTI